MSDSRFPILGTSVPPMLGRAAILQRLISALTKPVPDHLQVVGPRFAGKTVILNALAAHFRRPESEYSAVILWDLGHLTPATDDQFMQGLARELSSALKGKHADYAEYLTSTASNPYDEIAEVLENLGSDRSKVLTIFDGFDKLMANGQLTRNLWDRLRELAQKPSLRLVTASRRKLTELIRDPDAETSPLWNIFSDQPVFVRCFDDSDLSTILSSAPDLELAAGSKTELWNATNGFPVLMLSVLNEVKSSGNHRVISPDAMKVACDGAFSSLHDIVHALWVECSQSSQDLCRRVLEEESVARTGISTADAERLIERGFVHSAANKLQRPSRLLGRYLAEQPHEGNALVRLFGTADAYRRNVRVVLERRIGQLNGIDPTLRRYLERAVDDLPDHTDVFLSHVRGVVNQAFELIWKAEVPDKRIPSAWMAIWKRNTERGVDGWEATFPQGGARVSLLNLMTGGGKSAPCAKHVTRATYVLMNAVNAFGDFGQHLDGVRVDPGVAYAALHLCIELAAGLNRELPAGL
jgi:hypothetical protein